MKKFAVIFVVILSSCGQAPKEETQVPLFDSIVDEESSIDISMLDTVAIDSTSLKMSTLLSSTEHADKKVKEIKLIKEENKALKKELNKTKTELNDIKAALSDTIEGAD